jgi:hypothetical protein
MMANSQQARENLKLFHNYIQLPKRFHKVQKSSHKNYSIRQAATMTTASYDMEENGVSEIALKNL